MAKSEKTVTLLIDGKARSVIDPAVEAIAELGPDPYMDGIARANINRILRDFFDRANTNDVLQFSYTVNRTGELRPLVATDVPSTAETIISYLCTPDRLEAVLGDLQRNFARRAAKHGEKAARRWYWWQTARTVAAFGVQIVMKVVMLRALLEKLGL